MLRLDRSIPFSVWMPFSMSIDVLVGYSNEVDAIHDVDIDDVNLLLLLLIHHPNIDIDAAINVQQATNLDVDLPLRFH